MPHHTMNMHGVTKVIIGEPSLLIGSTVSCWTRTIEVHQGEHSFEITLFNDNPSRLRTEAELAAIDEAIRRPLVEALPEYEEAV